MDLNDIWNNTICICSRKGASMGNEHSLRSGRPAYATMGREPGAGSRAAGDMSFAKHIKNRKRVQAELRGAELVREQVVQAFQKANEDFKKNKRDGKTDQHSQNKLMELAKKVQQESKTVANLKQVEEGLQSKTFVLSSRENPVTFRNSKSFPDKHTKGTPPTSPAISSPSFSDKRGSLPTSSPSIGVNSPARLVRSTSMA